MDEMLDRVDPFYVLYTIWRSNGACKAQLLKLYGIRRSLRVFLDSWLNLLKL